VAKIGNPSGEALAGAWQRCSSVTERLAMLLRRALPAAGQSLAHSFPIYEIGSRGGAGNRFSIRIGNHHRAIGQVMGDVVEWVWIGSHEDYNTLI
jgi:hypothetical protein